MRAVIQRVKSASVTVEGKLISQIGPGLCVFIGISREDTESDSDYIFKKILNLRLFDNVQTEKRWSLNVVDRHLEILCVSQFTLYSTLKGNKLDFHQSMESERSRIMYEKFLNKIRNSYEPERIKDGLFGELMEVNIVNDGPITVNLESPSTCRKKKQVSTTKSHQSQEN